MVAHGVVETPPEILDRALQARVLEWGDAAAAVADEVMVVVLTARQRGLVAGRDPAHVEALHQAEALEQLEGPIDGRHSDLPSGATQLVGDLAGAEDAALPADQLQHRGAGSARAVPGLGERLLGPLDPEIGGRGRGVGSARTHPAPEDNRSQEGAEPATIETQYQFPFAPGLPIVLDSLQLPFMQRAMLEIVLLAPLAGVLGAQIVLRRLAFFAHGVGAAAFPGLVLAGPAGVTPAIAALAVGGAFAGLLERLERRRALAYDAATALLLVAALAIGIVLASDVFGSGAEVDGLLFGSLLAIGDRELAVTALALGIALVAALLARRSWIATGFDPAASRSLGLPARWGDRALLGAVTVAVVASLDAVGALLVGSILVIPAATARLFATSVGALELGAGLLALVEGLAGLLLALRLDAPPGAVIATLGGAIFAGCLGLRFLYLLRERAAAR